MRVKLDLAVLCKRSLIDKSTNELSLIDLIDQISAPPEVTYYPYPMDLTMLWRRDPQGEGVTKFDVLVKVYNDIANAEELKQVVKGSKEIGNNRLRIIVEVPGADIENAKELIVEVLAKEEDDQDFISRSKQVLPVVRNVLLPDDMPPD